MFRKAFLTGALCFATATSLLADFTYEQTSKITGGAMAGMMKMAGAFSKAAREPMVTTTVVKGDKMAHISTAHTSIIDLNTETITDIDFQRKQYSVITFADMKKAMEQMSEKMKEKQANSNSNMEFKADIKDTGQKKQINGYDTHEVILTLAMEGTDQKTGKKGAMTVATDMWLAKNVAGYKEIQEFYKRMSTKIAWAPGGMSMMGGNSDIAKGMSSLYKEASKLEGVPVYQIIKMGGAGDGSTPNFNTSTPPPQSSAPAPNVGEAAGGAAGSAAGSVAANKLGKLAGLGGMGGFGGFGGRKKKDTQDQPAQAPPPAAEQSAPTDASGALMEMTTEMTSFSAGPVDSSKFTVPAGFKQVENPLQKAANK